MTTPRLDITLVGEGVETSGERDTLYQLGVRYQQDYLFARLVVGALALA